MSVSLAILGSTGSIGRQTLEVVREQKERFSVHTLVANNRVDELIAQAIEFEPDVVVIGNEQHLPKLREALSKYPIKIFGGADAITDVVRASEIDVVVTAMVGFAGLAPTLSAIKAGKRIALANKETLVVAGDLIAQLSQQYKAPIVPVDSEHGAILQSLVGESPDSIEKLIITASGGPFRQMSMEQLQTITAKDALKHPTWQMGAKITIDSATLMNKGFEVIEAHHLFGVGAGNIDVVVHPQSIIHSMVQFKDGSIKAQLGATDMKIPILYALTFPQRVEAPAKRIDLAQIGSLTFEKPDTERFPNLLFAYDALRVGGNRACVVNAANEVAVDLFLKGQISFLQITKIIERTISAVDFIKEPTYEQLIETDRLARQIALKG